MATDMPIADATLSAAAWSVWAKSDRDRLDPTVFVEWLPLLQHLADSAAVAGLLWDRWVAPGTRTLIAARTGLSNASARALYVWLVGVHDLGKASPAFAVMVDVLAEAMSDRGLRSDQTLAGTEERRRARHELVSHIAVVDWLQHEREFDIDRATRLASVLAAHHGAPADAEQVRAARPQERLLGDSSWRGVREEILTWATARFVTAEDVEAWREARLPQHVLVLLSGLVIVADWIASNSDLFPLVPIDVRPSKIDDSRAAHAWRALDLPSPWTADAPIDDDILFRERFTLPGGATARPVQRELMHAARTLDQPALLILEAEMGVGKTEAALAAAEILADRFGLGGIFVGLPTQATADGMFSRILAWASNLGLTAPANVFLARGKSLLNEKYAELTKAAYYRSIGEEYGRRRDTASQVVVAHHWFSDPKRGPLASLVTGTIDQALFVGLRSRHLMLRHLALAGKVVILDEVHAYDAFMGQYLERLLHWLGAYRVPVIMLSATLPSASRRAFTAAYDRGRQWGSSDERPAEGRAGRKRRNERYAALEGDIGYPSIVVSGGEAPPRVILPLAMAQSKVVALERIDDDAATLIALLRSALRDGGNVAVVRNTVTRVQATAAALRAAFPNVALTVAHARFLAADRAVKDVNLLVAFGRNGDRPRAHIVVASQVIEQSLDLDFDLMVTDLAPVDLLLQRAGRLHRHDGRERPAPLNAPRLVVAGTDWTASPPEPVRGSQVVYSRYILLRTLAALHGRDHLTVPADIPSLVQSVYGDDPLGPEVWHPAIAEARAAFESERAGQRSRAKDFLLPEVGGEYTSLIGWASGGAGDPANEQRARGSVRDGEATLEVLVLQRDIDGVTHRTPSWLERNAGRQIPTGTVPDGPLTRIIAGCALRLPAAMCRGSLLDVLISELERSFELPIWHTSPSLKGELVLVFDAEGRATLGPFDLRYSREDGLEYSRLPESETP